MTGAGVEGGVEDDLNIRDVTPSLFLFNALLICEVLSASFVRFADTLVWSKLLRLLKIVSRIPTPSLPRTLVIATDVYEELRLGTSTLFVLLGVVPPERTSLRNKRFV